MYGFSTYAEAPFAALAAAAASLSGSGTNNCSLYITTIDPTGTLPVFLNLFLKAEFLPSTSGNVPLYINASPAGVSGLYSSRSLYTNGISYFSSMNLFIKATDTGDSDKRMNLYLAGEAFRANANLDLFLQNDGVSKQGNLYVRGSGIGAGGLPLEASMNLYIYRYPSAAATLYVNAPSPATASVNLFINASVNITGTVNLSIPRTYGRINPNLYLYTHGF